MVECLAMRQQLIFLAEAIWVGEIYFVIGFLGAWVYLELDLALTTGFVTGGFMLLVYLATILTNMIRVPLLWAFIFLILPFVGIFGVVIMRIARWFWELLGLYP